VAFAQGLAANVVNGLQIKNCTETGGHMSSFWDEFKKLFQTAQQREEEKSQKIKDALSKEQSVVEKLKELEEQYRQSLPKQADIDLEKLFPSTLELEKMDYDAPTDEQIKEQAQTQLLASLEKQKREIAEQIKSQKDKVESSKDDLTQDAEASLAKLDELYSSLKRQAEKNALKRGLGRSSIIMSQIGEYDKAAAQSAVEIEAALLKEISDANQKLVELETKRDEALSQLDLEHAGELEALIKKLTKERDDTVLKYQKHNNEVEKQLAEYNAERAKKVADYQSKIEKERLAAEQEQKKIEKQEGYSGEKLKNYSERYAIAFEFYNSLAPDIAADALAASPNMRFYLGNYYDKLMQQLKAKGNKTDRYF
jgi:hypothetical protein